MNHNQAILKMVELLGKKFIENDKRGIQLQELLHFNSFSELMLLSELGRTEPMSTQELLRGIELDRGILDTLIKNLMARKLIYKEKDEDDKRKAYIGLTDQGKEQVLIFRRIEEEAMQFVMKDMSINEQKAILKFLSRINQLTVDKYEE